MNSPSSSPSSSRSPNVAVGQIFWLLLIAWIMAAISIALMIVALAQWLGQDYGEILLMAGGTTNIFMQAFVLWPLAPYVMKKNPITPPYVWYVRYRHWLFFVASAITLISSAIGIIWRGR